MAKNSAISKAGQKTVNLLLYVTERLQHVEYGGATNLNKILYYIDGLNYINRGKSITTFKYVKREFGPTPDGFFMALREEMITKDMLELRIHDFHGLEQKCLIPKETANIDHFTKEELALIHDVIEYVGSVSARTISDLSHNLVYDLAKPGEEIPLYCFILQPREPSVEELTWGRSVVSDVHGYKKPAVRKSARASV